MLEPLSSETQAAVQALRAELDAVKALRADLDVVQADKQRLVQRIELPEPAPLHSHFSTPSQTQQVLPPPSVCGDDGARDQQLCAGLGQTLLLLLLHVGGSALVLVAADVCWMRLARALEGEDVWLLAALLATKSTLTVASLRDLARESFKIACAVAHRLLQENPLAPADVAPYVEYAGALYSDVVALCRELGGKMRSGPQTDWDGLLPLAWVPVIYAEVAGLIPLAWVWSRVRLRRGSRDGLGSGEM